jgi:hypothetical protein
MIERMLSVTQGRSLAFNRTKAEAFARQRGTFFVAGTTCVVAGIPIMIIGGSKKRNAMNSYLQQVSESPVKNAPYLQLNLHGNGMGLACVF